MNTKYKILIVDDDEINIEILEDILIDLYTVEIAMNGEDALQKMESFLPDVVLLDIMMPGIDGYEVCKRIRANDAYKYVKVLLVSAKAMVQERLEGYSAGADDYVTKPFDHNELLAKVNIFVKLKHEEEVDALKSDLLHLLSHEKRTPLNSILGLSELLLSTATSLSVEEKSYVKEIQKAGNVLLSQTEKTLTMCQFKKGIDLDFIKDAINDRIEDAISKTKHRFSDQKITVQTNLGPIEPFEYEPLLIENSIRYLIENAFEHSPNGSTITVTSIHDDKECIITVEDEGDGIPVEKMPTIFTEFNSEDILHHTRGLGISLPLIKKILEQHNGTITLTNKELGGICATVTIPYSIGG